MRKILVGLLCLAGCAPPHEAPSDPVVPFNFTNGGFDDGTFSSWTVTPALWGDGSGNAGFANFPPTTFSDLNLTVGTGVGTNVSFVTPGPTPTGLTMADSLTLPFDGADSAQVGAPIFQAASGMTAATYVGNHNSNYITQTMTVAASDVDPTDGKVHVRFAVAPVLNNPGGTNHTENQQPYFFIEIRNVTKNIGLANTFNFTNQPGVPYKNATTSDNSYTTVYTNWQTIDVAPGSGGIAIGDQISATVVATGCSFNAHWGEVYVDSFSTFFTVPTVSATAPARTNANSNLTYTITAHNGGTGATTGTVVDFTTPFLTDTNANANSVHSVQTKYVSTTNLPSGVTCTNPTVGTVGTVVCTIGSIPAGGAVSFNVTVKVPVVPVNYVGPDYVNAGSYDIHTTERPTPVNGTLVQTLITAAALADLHTTVSDGTTTSLFWGQQNTYTLSVTNNGPSDSLATTVTDTQPTTLTAVTWTCTATGGALCAAATGSGAISQVDSIPNGGNVTYTVTGTITGGPAASTFTYAATATPSPLVTQSVQFDNSASDTDTVSQQQFTLTVAAASASTGTGTITSNPAGISCGTTCSESVGSGNSVVLSASPDAGSAFTGWTGGGCGSANPCTVTVIAATTVTAQFDKTSFTTSLLATSNGNSQNVRVGDTADFKVIVTIPAGAVSFPLTIVDTFPTDLDATSATAAAITGSLTCAGATTDCTAPVGTPSGAPSTLDFGNVSCPAASTAGCTVTVSFRATVDVAATAGMTLVDAIVAAGQASQNLPTLTVIEPALTVSRSANPTTAIARGGLTTVTVTLGNTGNAPAYDGVVTLPTPAGFTASTYTNVDCPLATATFGSNAVFTLPTDSTGAIAAGTTCTFTYVLTESSTETGNAMVTVPAGTATSQSITGTAPPAKQYTTAVASFTLGTAAIANNGACGSASECVSNVCDSDGKCGYATGDGPCTLMNAADKCRSGACSSTGFCLAPMTCFADPDCVTATQFCDTAQDICVPRLMSGIALPTIAGHTPALDGTCGAGVGAAVCLANVCDGAKCGYANGDGPCTAGSICQSGFCSNSGTCGPAGGCLVDADCDVSTQYCDTATEACAPKVSNGLPIPSVNGHTPTLDGVCSTAEATVACVSAVCDTKDNDCGYADGDGPCTSTNASTVCRSGSCRVNGVCGSGCAMDSDCSSTQFCNTQTAACAPKIANGGAVPTITGHTPTLDGTCSTTVATAVCVAAVCDTKDNECGYPDGDGPCTTAAQCRSGQCNDAGTCGPSAITPVGTTTGLAGGGFTCAMGPSSSPSSSMALLLLLGGLWVIARRRRA